MPSDDSMPVKKGQADDQDDDNKSLGSILKGRKKTAPAASKVKKEVPADGNVDSLSLSKAGGSAPRVRGTNKVKKQEEEEDDDDDNVPISVKPSSAAKNVKESTKKSKIKQAEDVKENKKAAAPSTDQAEKKRVRKVYDLPGQKRDTPEEREPLRIFYESLYKQNPSSEMAQFWMMESGLLEKEVAKRIFERKQKGKLSYSPAKSAGNKSVQRSSQTTAKKKLSTPVSSETNKKKTTITTTKEVKVNSSKKQKRGNNKGDGSSEDESDDDFVMAKVPKKKKAAAA